MSLPNRLKRGHHAQQVVHLLFLLAGGSTLFAWREHIRPGNARWPSERKKHDNFHPKAGTVKRLSPEELEKEVNADFAGENKTGRALSEKAVGPQANDIVPPHRLSRDAVSAKSFANAVASRKKVRGTKRGDTLVVMGMPRIDLALVSWRTRDADQQPEALMWNLPYEVIVVGVYEDQNTEAAPPSATLSGRVVESPRTFPHLLLTFLARVHQPKLHAP
jgi:hypothetical protein